jgi:hypothetical protein
VGNGPLMKIKAATAAEICAHFNLPKEARALLRDGIAPREFADDLLANKQHVAGIDFIAHGLPAREAIWWGCLCMQHAYGDELAPADKAAASAAVRWVLQPTEENRTAAKAPAEVAGAATTAGSLAGAVSHTASSAAPSNGPPPAPFAPSKLVATAIKLASIKGDPARMAHRQRSFFELGIGVAEGKFL